MTGNGKKIKITVECTCGSREDEFVETFTYEGERREFLCDSSLCREEYVVRAPSYKSAIDRVAHYVWGILAKGYAFRHTDGPKGDRHLSYFYPAHAITRVSLEHE
jgi:hypothetical protein